MFEHSLVLVSVVTKGELAFLYLSLFPPTNKEVFVIIYCMGIQVIIVRVIFYYHSSVSYGDRYWLFQNDFLKRKNNVWHLIFPDRVLSVSRRVIVLNRIAWSKTAGYLFHNLIRVKGFHYFDFIRFPGRLTGRLTSSLFCQNVHWLGFLCWYWILTYIFCFTFTFRR